MKLSRFMVRIGVCALLVCAHAHLALGDKTDVEEDFQFDVNDDIQVEFTEPNAGGPVPLRRLWGVPDMTAHAGRLFALNVPQEAFSGHVNRYEARGIPSWLLFDGTRGVFRGVPLPADIGEASVTVRAVGDIGHAAKDAFMIEVRKIEDTPRMIVARSQDSCQGSQRDTILTILIGGTLKDIKPRQRVKAIDSIAKFFGMPHAALSIQDISHNDVSQLEKASIKGGSSHHKQHSSDYIALQAVVGCGGHTAAQHKPMLMQIGSQVRDGTIAEIIGLPVVRWMVGQAPKHEIRIRNRRQTNTEEGSAFDQDSYDDYYDETEDENEGEGVTTAKTTPNSIIPVTPSHPHRHHHGEEPVLKATFATDLLAPGSSAINNRTDTTSVASTVQQVNKNITDAIFDAGIEYYDSEDDDEKPTEISIPITPVRETIVPYRATTEMSTEPTRQSTMQVTASTYNAPSTSVTQYTSERETTDVSTTPEPTTIPVQTTPTTTTEQPTQPTTVIVSTTPASTTLQETPTTPKLPTTMLLPATNATTTERPTTIQTTTETVVFEAKNFAPTIQQRLKKLAVTAGKTFSYVIPDNSFQDLEDGTDLRFAMHDMTGSPLKHSSWVQFNPSTREAYGLPLEKDVSKWEFVITATDKEGASVSDRLEITVQHHKGRRTVNHEVTLAVRVEKRLDVYKTDVDWQIRVLKGLAAVFHDPDMSQITVLHVHSFAEPLQITWTNDTLPRDTCPHEEIEALLKTLQAGTSGDPSPALYRAMNPELRVKRVTGGGVGTCAPSDPVPPPRATQDNFAPIPRNQVDHINATVGQLLVFKVPEDSFYDPEDGSNQFLKLYLLNSDRDPLPPTYWLQFDTKNQEFYGVPSPSDVGQRGYLLVCEDSGGLTATDGLIVEVHSSPKKDYMVEFSVTIDTPYESFIHSAGIQRKFIDKVADLFNDQDTKHIKVNRVTPGSTVVNWSNVTLTGPKCQEEEIRTLKSVLLRHDDSLHEMVDRVMSPEFTVRSAKVTKTGVCLDTVKVVYTPDVPPKDDTFPIASSSDDYLITFIVPAIIIAIMLLLASVIACVLYRRRRTGKMELGDEEERQSFRNKGIPVIFQDELEEKPDPCNKSPVILKDEKPPLLPPPEYKGLDSPQNGDSGDEDAPYQPPPPFATNRDTARNSRPKPTPTYRKPPPYVPP